MRRHVPLSGLAVAACIMGAMPALATDFVTVTYTGTARGKDVDGAFGARNAILSGALFTATYVFDPTIGNVFHGPTQDFAEGGSNYGVATPLISATLQINGHSLSVGGSAFGEISDSQSDTSSQQYVSAGNGRLSLFNYVTNYSFADFGDVGFYDFDADLVGVDDSEGALFQSNGTPLIFTNRHLTISGFGPRPVVALPTPEPASWAMMLAGFGLVGGALRQRRRTTLRFA